MSKFLEKMSDETLDSYTMNCILQAQKGAHMLDKYKQKALAAGKEKIKRILKKSS